MLFYISLIVTDPLIGFSAEISLSLFNVENIDVVWDVITENRWALFDGSHFSCPFSGVTNILFTFQHKYKSADCCRNTSEIICN